ncbi:hypothetical protein [Alicyclobacillus fodiniaquatilis]|uniref:TMhelix containing protein n=1 Tax=Alicyclobacillus fodiniaquatilis TaxID=1661150 RepID=A0ABW4JGC9_9BACL
MNGETQVREIETPRDEVEVSGTNTDRATVMTEIRRAAQEEKHRAQHFIRWLKTREMKIASNLLFWCLIFVMIVFFVEVFRFKDGTFATQVFDLLKTIIVAVLGFLFGQRSKGND